tara:strand:+ start:759 stop:1475 length:717 start_codon:yes stop_codon:yes gene_type:complete
MALPKLNNDVPKYEFKVPSTKEIKKYRPFLVKEQKVLLVAFESKDDKMVLNSMLDCIKGCVQDFNVYDAPTYDVDYAFLQVRAKSVGETAKIVHTCSDCNTENTVSIRIDEIGMDVAEKKKEDFEIKINDNITLELQHPNYKDVISNTGNSNDSETVALFKQITSCLKAVKTDDEYIRFKDEDRKEVETFVDSLTQQQLEQITQFIQNVPKIKHSQKYECKKCKKENTLELEGLQDFF